MATGIFFHYQQGERLKDFPQALQGILDEEDVYFYDAYYPSKPESIFDLPPIPEYALHRTHSKEMVERVNRAGASAGALFSAAGTYLAAQRVWADDRKNAFVFTGYGDHHAGSHFFGGGCYFNGAAIAIRELETRNPTLRFAVIDTDAHHGDGSWELFENDPRVLYLCFCNGAFEEKNCNVNIHIPLQITDAEYVSLVSNNLQERLGDFGPELIFWNVGYHGTVGEYGDMGLTTESHVRLASVLKELAEELCKGRLIVVLCGGSRRDLASFIIPRVIKMLVS
jgi:acetoin utilization deacetylase AcuC-like enzyme